VAQRFQRCDNGQIKIEQTSPQIVILSEDFASQREAKPQSKDPDCAFTLPKLCKSVLVSHPNFQSKEKVGLAGYRGRTALQRRVKRLEIRNNDGLLALPLHHL
jgi:hypothetical protein